MSFSNALIAFAGIRILGRPRNPPFLLSVLHQRRRYATNVEVHDNSLTEDFNTLVDKLKTPEHPHTIHRTYPVLVAQLRERRQNLPVPPPLNQRHLVAILQRLGESGRPADLQRIEELLSDTSAVFGVDPSLDIHSIILRALKKNGNLQTMYRWVLHMPRRPGNFNPTIEQFHLVLEACVEYGSFKQMRNMVLSMRKAGCKPTVETFKILLRARWEFAAQEEKIPHVIVFSTILDDMKREGLSYNQSLSDLLFSGYADRGMLAYAEQIRTLYQQQFPHVQSLEEEQNLAWNLKLSQIAQSRGIKAALAMFRSLEKEGCVATSPTIRALLRHSRAPADLQLVTEELKVKPSVDHYSLLISNCIRAGQLSNAMSLYDHAKGEGLRPEAALVAPLIKSLCGTAGPLLEESLDKALVLYQDISACHPATIPGKEKTSYMEHSSGPDPNIYQMLLRGLASSPHLEKYLPIALSLLEDMDARRISKDDSIIASSIVVLHMRNARSPAEALDSYREHRSSLDEKGYAVVLNAYTKLNFGKDIHVPSLMDYFSIVKDMRHAGLAITTEVYTIILQQLSIVATQLNQRWPVDEEDDTIAKLRNMLITTTRRTHDLLTLDANVSPDAHVWNQLMDTYQRLGCFGDAYRVWELMYLSGRFDHVSVSIIFDACGYAAAWQVAKQVRARLSKDGFKLNLHNWNTFIECLCRLRRLEDAVKVVCVEMGKNGEASPDTESVRILLKFAMKSNQQAEVLSRIHRYLPDLWKSLPEELRNS
ncbi:hypothetical protein M378DRAFT_115037 [Amanita muscaria Koide BX008]|uniref:Pentatricopeptide repeat-containing protein n=1 Tax=Amanita muscaria (strain Koide BX008) TaxID=946122 RepID=A0A0C2XPX2_AMAMK|nr:hypothetical protein M378DRAFT_115037 [Amanita muscaria Koide BX008]